MKNVPDNEDLAVALEAASEMEALMIQSFLQSRGIEAALRSRQIPMYDGIARVWNPVWGYVLVMSGEEERARELIRGRDHS
jgi:hypothetical protein